MRLLVDAVLIPSLNVVGVIMGMLLLPWAPGIPVREPIKGCLPDVLRRMDEPVAIYRYYIGSLK